MNRIVLGATALAILSGIALATPAAAHGLTYRERVAIANSKSHLDALRSHARVDRPGDLLGADEAARGGRPPQGPDAQALQQLTSWSSRPSFGAASGRPLLVGAPRPSRADCCRRDTPARMGAGISRLVTMSH